MIDLIEQGKVAGWSTAEITTALIALADNLMLADVANSETDRQIKEAIERLRHG